MRLLLIFPTLVLIMILSACSTPANTSPQSQAPTATPDSHSGASMDHGSSMSSGTTPYDAQFIDSMIVHHEGAISMAKQAQQSAEHPELRTLADAIITAQAAEITQMKAWRTSWYPELAAGQSLGMDMGSMSIPDGSIAFDQRFIESMIDHHEGAISMARDAQQKAEHPEIKTLAQAIITAQEGEITQMKQWLKTWYGVEK